MGWLTNRLKIAFHISKLALSMFFAYAFFRWRVRKATGSFKVALLNEGLPTDVARTLTESYRESNRKILGLVSNGLAFSKDRVSKDPEV